MSNYICPICGGKDSKHKFFGFDYDNNKRDKKYEIKQCNSCRLEYIYPLPMKEEQILFYPDNYYSKHLKENKKSFKDKCLSLESILFSVFNNKNFDLPNQMGKGKNFLDIGCGDGKNIEIMKKRGWNAEGFEIGDSNEYINNIYYGNSIVNIDFGKKYDVIYCNHVFEHVDNPLEFLEKVKLILKDDGIFIINLPNIDNISSSILGVYDMARDVPRHIFGYNYSNIQKLFIKKGFKIINKHKGRQQGTATSIAWWLIGKYNKDIRGSILHLLIGILFIPIELFLSIIKNTNTMGFVLKK